MILQLLKKIPFKVNMNTLEFTVLRREFKDTYTMSDFLVNGTKLCDVLEDTDRGLDSALSNQANIKIPSETAIPYGRYKVQLYQSPRFKRLLPLLINVPYFEGILIHRGNTHKDTAGCLLPGTDNKNGTVINSAVREVEIVKLCEEATTKGQEIWITIKKK